MSPTINPYEQRIAVQTTLWNVVQRLMIDNELSPSVVEDALNKCIINLHPQIIAEIIEDGERIKRFEAARAEMNEAVDQMNVEQNQSIPADQEEVSDA